MQGRWFHRIIIGTSCALLLILAAGVGSAHAWWDGKWKYRKKIVLDTTPQGGDVKEALNDFPVLVRLHTGNFTFENAKADGSDIRFVASDDKTPLKYHIERYDPKEEMVLIWVKVPQIAPASAEGFIWLYYGNGSAAAGEDAGGTFDTSPARRLSPRGKGRPAPGCHRLQEQRQGVYRKARHPFAHRPRHHA